MQNRFSFAAIVTYDPGVYPVYTELLRFTFGGCNEKRWMKVSGSASADCQIIYAGDMTLSREGIRVSGWNRVGRV
jgi:hypothetical protein